MRFIQLDATTWMEPQSGMLVTDAGAGTPLAIAQGGNTRTVPMPQADRLRAVLNHNPVIVPPSDSPGMRAAGVTFWHADRTPQEMAGNGGTNGP